MVKSVREGVAVVPKWNRMKRWASGAASKWEGVEGKKRMTGNGRVVLSRAEAVSNSTLDAIPTCAWYPFDAGLFATGSSVGHLHIWDAFRMQNVATSTFPDPISQISMSKLAASHSLVAVASDCNMVKLYDIRSDAVTQMLMGHTNHASTVKWTLHNEFQLISGGQDCALIHWDIRRAGCLAIMDANGNHVSNRADALKGTLSKTLTEKNIKTSHSSRITGIHFLESGQMVTSALNGEVRSWDYYPQSCLFKKAYDFASVSLQAVCSRFDAFETLVYFPNCTSLAIYENGKVIKKLKGHLQNISACQYNPNLVELYSSAGQSILIWDLFPKAENDENDDELWED